MSDTGEPLSDSRRILLFPSGRPRRAPPPARLTIGDYQLIGEIARGGMGTVYLCRRDAQAGFRRLYALKVMHEHLAEESEFIGMFLDEARIAARIHHPNVVGILDLGLCEQGHYVVMEYVEGCALGELLYLRRTSRPPELLIPLVLDLLSGLHAAHTLEDDDGEPLMLVHRDVSPSNLLVGVDGVARLTDFGVAKARARITSTRPGLHKGKLAYAAPEQLRDPASVDARADVFAAGVLLWTVLTGRSLFRGDSDAATVHNLLHRAIPRPSLVGFRPPACLDKVCLRALERDPEQRFSSALEMAAALREVALKERLLAAPADIARWLTDSFSEELAARRRAIRDAAAWRQTLGGIGEPPVLPVIHHAREGGSHSPIDSAAFAGDGEPLGEDADLEGRREPETKERARPAWIRRAAAVAAVLSMAVALAAVGLAAAERGALPEPLAPALQAPSLLGTAAPPWQASVPILKVTPPAEPDSDGAERDTSSPGAEGRETTPPRSERPAKTDRPPRRRRRARRPSPSPARESGDAEEPKPSAPAARDAATSEPDPEPPRLLEKNPYRRRR